MRKSLDLEISTTVSVPSLYPEAEGCVPLPNRGTLLAREFFNPEKGHSIRLPTPALPGCSPLTANRRSILSVFWYSEVEVLPAHLTRVLRRYCLRAVAARNVPRPVVPGGRVGMKGTNKRVLRHPRSRKSLMMGKLLPEGARTIVL